LDVLENAVPVGARQLVAPWAQVCRLGGTWDGRWDTVGANGVVNFARRLQTWCRHGLLLGSSDRITFLLRIIFRNHGRRRCQVHDQMLAGPQRNFTRRNRAADHHMTLPEPELELLA